MAGEPSNLISRHYSNAPGSDLDAEGEEDIDLGQALGATGKGVQKMEPVDSDLDAEGEDEDAEGEEDDEPVRGIKIAEDDIEEEDGDEEAIAETASEANGDSDVEDGDGDTSTETEAENEWEAESDTTEAVEEEIVDPNKCM
jgi:hypothetical protein